MAEYYRSLTAIANDHDFTTTFTNEYDKDQTDADLITPTTGKLLKITGIYISTEGGTAAGNKIRLEFNTTGNTVATFFPTTTPDTYQSEIIIRGAQNEALQITSDLGGDVNYFIAINFKME